MILNLSATLRSHSRIGGPEVKEVSNSTGENPNCVKPFHAQTVLHKPLGIGFASSFL